MNRPCFMLIGLLALAGCDDDPTQPDQAGLDVGPPADAELDMAPGDMAGPDLALPDAAPPDLGAPDAAPLTFSTLAHHDGTEPGQRLFSPWLRQPEDLAEMAVGFDAPAGPVQVAKVRLWATNPTDMPLAFAVRVYAEVEGRPGVEITAASPRPVVPVGEEGQWLEIPFPEPWPELSRFWIGVEWKPTPLASERGTNSFFVSTDAVRSAGPHHMLQQAGAWRTFEAAGMPASVGDVFIEVDVAP